MRLRVDRTWDGQPARREECVTLDLHRSPAEQLVIRVDAPLHDDPPPPGEPHRPTDRLWEYEVVELFLLAPPDHYLEIELGPHGHYCVLELQGVRQPVRTGLRIDFEAQVEPGGARWHGEARIPLALVPAGTRCANAYAIHGLGNDRRYLAWRPVPGPAPDFHRLERFGPIDLATLPAVR